MNKDINWNDPNLDLDSILGEGFEDIDKELDEDGNPKFYFDTNKSIDGILDLDLNEKFSDYYYKLYSGDELLGVIEYSTNDKGDIHIDFFGTINGDLNKVVTDDEFIQKFKSYFGNSNEYIKGIGKKTFSDFLKKFDSDTIFSFISLDGAQGFYDKILGEMEADGLISVLGKTPEYKFILI